MSFGSHVLDELHPVDPTYAVLDGARDRRLRGFIFDPRAPG